MTITVKKIKSSDLIRSMRGFAAKHPNYIYRANFDTCLYVDPITLDPMCIVGKGMVDCGIDPELLVMLPTEFIDMYEDFVDFDGDGHGRWISAAQDAQDNPKGFTFAKAIEMADAAVPEIAREVK